MTNKKNNYASFRYMKVIFKKKKGGLKGNFLTWTKSLGCPRLLGPLLNEILSYVDPRGRWSEKSKFLIPSGMREIYYLWIL